MFGKKKPVLRESFDREKEYPVIRSSICTGEQVAGFKEKESGRFREILCIRSREDQKLFLETYGLGLEEVRREW